MAKKKLSHETGRANKINIRGLKQESWPQHKYLQKYVKFTNVISVENSMSGVFGEVYFSLSDCDNS